MIGGVPLAGDAAKAAIKALKGRKAAKAGEELSDAEKKRRCPSCHETKKGRTHAPTADEVKSSIKELEEKHGMKFGQDFVFTEGQPAAALNKPGQGIQGKMELLENWKPGDPGIELPQINKNGVIIEGHHTAIAMHLRGELTPEVVSSIREGAIKFQPSTVIPSSIDQIRIMDGGGRVLSGPKP